MRKLLQGLFLFGNLIAALYAMEDPGNLQFQTKVKDNNLCLHIRLPNSGLYSEIPVVDLRCVFVDNWLTLGHVNNLRLVCKEWYQLTNNFFTVITDSDYKDPATPEKLMNNSSIVHLALLLSMETLYEDNLYKTYEKVVLKGLQNKPNLKKLTIDYFTIGLFCNYSRQLNGENEVEYSPSRPTLLSLEKNPPADLLKLAHLTCFLNLEELEIKMLEGTEYNWDSYFLEHFINPRVLPNLKRFKIETRGIDQQF